MAYNKAGNIFMEYFAMFLIFLLIFENYSQTANHYIQSFVLPLGLVFSGFLLVTSRITLKVALVWLTVIVAGLLNIALVGNLGFFYMTRTLFVHFPLALFFLQHPFTSHRVWKWFLVALLFFFTVVWIRSDGIQFFYQSSRNYVSIYVIFILCLYAAYLHQQGKELSWHYFLYGFLISVSAVGRGGIISTGIMLVLYLIYSFFKSRGNIIYLIPFFVLLLLVIYFVLFANVEVFFSRFFDYRSARSDTTRLNLVTFYIYSTRSSISNLLWGAKLSGIYGLVTSNLHNSYVQLHSYYGALGTISVFYWLLGSVKFLFKNSGYILLILLTGFLIRASTDFMFISGFSDIILFYFILLPYRSLTQTNSLR